MHDWTDWVDLGFFFWYLTLEHPRARWLPWWRRYLASLPWLIDALFFDRTHPLAGHALCWTAILISWWNIYTSNKNKRDGKDMRKLEAARAELTETQVRAFRREVAEAR